MNWKGIANWALSALGAFAMGFFGVPMFLDGADISVQLSAGASAGISALVQHIRNNPFKL